MKKIYLNKKDGFTLMELMVTLAIAGILIGIAVPSFVNMVRDNQGIANTNQLSGVFRWARTEAIKQGTAVTLCASTNQTSCVEQTSWADGWIVFIDQNGDGAFNDNGDATLCVKDSDGDPDIDSDGDGNPKVDAPEDCLLRSHGSISNATLTASQDSPLIFTNKGLPESESSYSLTYKPDHCPGGDEKITIVTVGAIGKTSKNRGICP